MSNNQTNSKEDRSSELSALKIACTIGSNSFVLSELKKAQKKNDNERYEVCYAVAKRRKILPQPKIIEMKDHYWAL